MGGQEGSEKSKVLSRVIAKAWADTEYKKRLVEDAAAVLKEEGLELPADVTIRVMEDTDELKTLVLPPPPADGLAVQEVEERLAAGGVFVGLPC